MARVVDAVFSFARTVSHLIWPMSNRPRPILKLEWSLCRRDSHNSHRLASARAPGTVDQGEVLLWGRDAPICGQSISSGRSDSSPTWRCWRLAVFLLRLMHRYRCFRRSMMSRRLSWNPIPVSIQPHVRPIDGHCLDATVLCIYYFCYDFSTVDSTGFRLLIYSSLSRIGAVPRYVSPNVRFRLRDAQHMRLTIVLTFRSSHRKRKNTVRVERFDGNAVVTYANHLEYHFVWSIETSSIVKLRFNSSQPDQLSRFKVVAIARWAQSIRCCENKWKSNEARRRVHFMNLDGEFRWLAPSICQQYRAHTHALDHKQRRKKQKSYVRSHSESPSFDTRRLCAARVLVRLTEGLFLQIYFFFVLNTFILFFLRTMLNDSWIWNYSVVIYTPRKQLVVFNFRIICVLNTLISHFFCVAKQEKCSILHYCWWWRCAWAHRLCKAN